MRRHGPALGLLLTSAAVVASSLVAVPTAGAGSVPQQVVYIDAGDHLMVGAVDGSDRPRALAPGLTVGWAWLSPSGETVTGTFGSGGAGALLLRTRSRSATQILSTHGAWTVRPYDGGGALFMDSRGGVYDVSSSGTTTRRSVYGVFAGAEQDEYPRDVLISPSRSKVAHWWTSNYCEQGLVVDSLSVDAWVSRSFGEGHCGYPHGQVLGWLDDDTVLYSYPSAATAVDPQDSIVFALDVWPSMAPTATDTGLRGITRIEHWGSQWWFWRADGSEYGVSPSGTMAPASWSTVPPGMTIVGAVTTDPAIVGASISNRSSTEAHLSVQPSSVTVGSSPSLQGYAYYGVDPPGWSRDEDASPLAEATLTGVLYESTDAGATWRLIRRTSGWGRFELHVVTRNVWLKWRHPGYAFTRSSTSVVRKVTAVPVITVSETGSATSTATRISGTVTRANGTARLLRWTGSSWAAIDSTSITSTGSFGFGWHVYAHGRYRVSVPATTYWGSATRTWYR